VSVRLTLRVVRFSKRAPRRSSSSFTCWLTMLAEMPSRAAAPAKLLLSTTLAKTRMLSKRSTRSSDYEAIQNGLFGLSDIIKGLRRVYSIGGGNARGCHMLTLCKSTILGAGVFGRCRYRRQCGSHQSQCGGGGRQWRERFAIA